MKGESYNMFSAADSQWHQTWIDSRGRRLDLTGAFSDGKMVLSGETPTAKGVVHDKITWETLDDGRVRQHWQRSNDKGETWNDVFVGFYTKRKE